VPGPFPKASHLTLLQFSRQNLICTAHLMCCRPSYMWWAARASSRSVKLVWPKLFRQCACRQQLPGNLPVPSNRARLSAVMWSNRLGAERRWLHKWVAWLCKQPVCCFAAGVGLAVGLRDVAHVGVRKVSCRLIICSTLCAAQLAAQPAHTHLPSTAVTSKQPLHGELPLSRH
jgi:hypothetical protein